MQISCIQSTLFLNHLEVCPVSFGCKSHMSGNQEAEVFGKVLGSGNRKVVLLNLPKTAFSDTLLPRKAAAKGHK